MAQMSERQLIAVVDAEFASSMGASGGEIGNERARAWDYYLSKPEGKLAPNEGESQVVSSDVSDVVDGIIPSLLRIFTTADNLLNFKAEGEEDVEQAAQESDYVNYVFFKENPAFLILYTWFFDALVQKNGIVKAWWDESETVTQESYQGLSDEEVADLLDDDELEIVERSESEGETVEETVIEVAPGVPLPVQELVPATVHDITFRRVSKRGQVRIEGVPPEEYRISADSRSVDPSDARLVGQESEKTRSDLLDMGFSAEIVDSLPAIGDELRSDEAISRRDKTDETDDAPHDRSQEKILVREGFIKVDFDGDGRSELRQVMTSNGKVLSNDVADRQPFHVICPQPLPHKHFGRATAEKVMDVQEVTTALTRQTLTNLYHSNRPSHAVWEQGIGENTLDDLLTRRIGSINRFSRPPSESYMPMQVPFTAQSSFSMLEYFDKVKRDRTGISSDGEGLSPEALKNIQTTVLAQAVDISKMKQEAIARIFAETGMKSLFLHIHELVLKHQDKPRVVELRNQWVEVNPQEWRTRLNMTVNIGLGIGTREQNLLHLNAIWEKQAAIVQNGGGDTLVSGQNIWNTAKEFVKNANLKNPEMFFTDPGNQPLAQQSGEAEALQKQQLELQQRQQQLDAERQAVNAAKIQLQAERQQIEVLRDRAKLQLDAAELDRKVEADKDKFTVEMEKIKNQITELELDSGRNVPGARV